MLCRAAHAAPAPSAPLFSAAVRSFWSVEPRPEYPFFDHEPLKQLDVLPPDGPDASRYRNAARLFERFLATADAAQNSDAQADERLAISHYFAAMAWFRIGAWSEVLPHFDTLLQRWPDYQRPRLNGHDPDLGRPVRADLLHLRFYLMLQIKPLSQRLPSAAPLAVLQELTAEASMALDVIEPRDAQRARLFNQASWPLSATLEVMEPQPDQLRAAALPTVSQMVESAYAELLPPALAKSGPQAVRAHLRALQTNSHFAALAQKLLIGIDAQIVKQYFAEAQSLLNAHNFDGARAKYRQISTEYPDSDAAQRAEAALPQIVTTAVNFYKSEGDKNFRPSDPDQFFKPQTKAREYFEKMYREDPDGPQADYALYYWSRGLGTEGKPEEAVAHYTQILNKFPNSSLVPAALFGIGFIQGAIFNKQYDKAIATMMQIVDKYPNSKKAPLALWYCAFWRAYGQERYTDAMPYLEKLRKYPDSMYAKQIDDELAKYHVWMERQKTP